MNKSKNISAANGHMASVYSKSEEAFGRCTSSRGGINYLRKTEELECEEQPDTV